MDDRRVEIVFFVALLGISIFFSWLILQPYLSALVLAATLALVFRPVYRNLLRGFKSPFLAASGTVILVVLIVFIPLGFFGVRIFGEATSLYASLTSSNGFNVSTTVNHFLNANFASLNIPAVTFNFNDLARQALTWLIQNLGPLFSSVAQVLFIAFLSLLGLFYFLKDGEALKKWTLNAVPLKDEYTQQIVQETEGVVGSVVRGTLVVSILQGIAAGIGFFIFHIPNPAFWGAVMVILSLVPIVGAWLVAIPAIAYLFFIGQTVPAIGLTIWSVLFVNLIYNVLSPQLMHRGINIHPYVILLSVLGGIGAFGPIGFLLGPFVIALLFSLLDIYPKLVLKHKPV